MSSFDYVPNRLEVDTCEVKLLDCLLDKISVEYRALSIIYTMHCGPPCTTGTLKALFYRW